MTKRQTIIILCIISAPVIVGSLLILTSQEEGGAFSLTAQGKKIGLVKIFDVIYSAENYVKQLEEFRKDNSIAGVILRIDSPGGAVAPSQEIYKEVLQYRESHKSLVVSMGNVAASGGYYIASPASKIFANPGTITGSIGVIFQFPHYYKLLDKLGISMTTIKAGKLKDVGNPNRELTEKERRYLQALIDNTHTQFITHVSEARAMEIDTVRSLADGRIFTGQQALEIGLIDSLGGYSDALAYLKKSLNLPEKTKVIEKKRHPGILNNLFAEGILKHIPFINNSLIPAGTYFLLEHF